MVAGKTDGSGERECGRGLRYHRTAVMSAPWLAVGWVKGHEVPRKRLPGLPAHERENCILRELWPTLGVKPLGTKQRRYIRPFRFKNDAGTRISHRTCSSSASFYAEDCVRDHPLC